MGSFLIDFGLILNEMLDEFWNLLGIIRFICGSLRFPRPPFWLSCFYRGSSWLSFDVFWWSFVSILMAHTHLKRLVEGLYIYFFGVWVGPADGLLEVRLAQDFCVQVRPTLTNILDVFLFSCLPFCHHSFIRVPFRESRPMLDHDKGGSASKTYQSKTETY